MPNQSRVKRQAMPLIYSVSIVMASFAQALAAIDGSDQERIQACKEAVIVHFETAARVVTPEEKMGVPHSVEARRVNDWPFQERLHEHALFVAIVKNGYTRYRLAAVDRSLGVWVINDRDSYNDLLMREGILIRSEQDARFASELFLSAIRIGFLLDSGWELGINVVRSPDDITFRDAKDRERLTRAVELEPPQVSKRMDGFEYSVYGWEKTGSGIIKRYRVLLSEKGIRDLTVDHILGNVGAWNPLM